MNNVDRTEMLRKKRSETAGRVFVQIHLRPLDFEACYCVLFALVLSVVRGPSLVRRISPRRRKLRLERIGATVLSARNGQPQIFSTTTEISDTGESTRSALGITRL